MSLFRLISKVCLLAAIATHAHAYAVFTHEQLIDLSWNTIIRPLLLARYPKTTQEGLRRAHAYAYGGCVIQDLGYYPFGKQFFSDLTHYVRTGDFIQSLLRNAHTVDEYAFALGALSHFVGDNIGHHDAVNPATAQEFPKLAHKFGNSVTYDEGPYQHVRTEFGFDIAQLNQHRLAPSAYLRYIGLRVSRPLLEKAFYETYALNLNEILGPGRRPSFQTYRWAVRSFLPRVAYAENLLHRGNFEPDPAGEALDVYQRRLAQADFEKTWNQYRRGPGFRTYAMAFLLVIVPKVGPLSVAAIRVPNANTEELYLKSVNHTVAVFGDVLARLSNRGDNSSLLANRDLDTGERSRPGTYPLTDKTYAKLIHQLVKLDKSELPPGLKTDILAFYDGETSGFSQQIQTDLERLRQLPAASE